MNRLLEALPVLIYGIIMSMVGIGIGWLIRR